MEIILNFFRPIYTRWASALGGALVGLFAQVGGLVEFLDIAVISGATETLVISVLSGLTMWMASLADDVIRGIAK